MPRYVIRREMLGFVQFLMKVNTLRTWTQSIHNAYKFDHPEAAAKELESLSHTIYGDYGTLSVLKVNG